MLPYPGDDTKARCAVCCVTLQAHLKGLKTHNDTQKHKENLRVKTRRQPSIATALKDKKLDPVKVNELKLAIFTSVHTSNLTIDHLRNLASKYLMLLQITLQI